MNQQGVMTTNIDAGRHRYSTHTRVHGHNKHRESYYCLSLPKKTSFIHSIVAYDSVVDILFLLGCDSLRLASLQLHLVVERIWRWCAEASKKKRKYSCIGVEGVGCNKNSKRCVLWIRAGFDRAGPFNLGEVLKSGRQSHSHFGLFPYIFNSWK